MIDVLVVGAGPAGLAIAAALCDLRLSVAVLAPASPGAAWPNTYGVWVDELADPALQPLLGQRWTDCAVCAGGRSFALGREYGLFDNARLQAHLLHRCERANMTWHQGTAQRVYHAPDASHLVTSAGETITARVVIDASGHAAALVQRPAPQRVAHQVAFGIVGTFSAPPVRAGQLVLMDFRYDHLPGDAKAAPPTFLYAMHLGGDRYFVEETSLASKPPMSFEVLEQRLYRRLAARGVTVRTIEHTEHCLFPMNLPLPYLDQPILAYGGAASMVHPASGYQVGAALRLAPRLAAALAQVAGQPNAGPVALARAGWDALWPSAAVRNRNLYELGLHSLLNFNAAELDEFFGAFFQLPYPAWTGYLSNTLTTPQIVRDMVGLFIKAPNQIRAGLVRSALREPALLTTIVSGP